MGPWEFISALLVVPLVGAMIWIIRRFIETDGAPVPEFESWCRETRPLLLAFRCTAGSARAVAFEVAVALGGARQVVNHRGHHPWTRYIFDLEIAHDEVRDVVTVRAIRCAMRRGVQSRPEIGAVVDRLASELQAALQELWLHGELHSGDGTARADRLKFGWIATIGDGAQSAFSPMIGVPRWLALRDVATA
jgi:hypothetical protein